MNVAYAPRGAGYAPNYMPLLRAACKVLVNALHMLINYAHCQCCLLNDTNGFLLPWLQAACHTPQIYFL
jgi:hypothetical protein